MSAVNSKAQLSMKYLFLDGVSSLEQGNRQEAHLLEHSTIFILDFPYTFTRQVYLKNPLRENYDI